MHQYINLSTPYLNFCAKKEDMNEMYESLAIQKTIYQSIDLIFECQCPKWLS